MLKANLGNKKITENTEKFSLKGMIEPTFYNYGKGNVRVFHAVIKPGESFLAGVHNMVMDNEIPIEFEGTNKSDRNLIVYFGTPVSNC